MPNEKQPSGKTRYTCIQMLPLNENTNASNDFVCISPKGLFLPTPMFESSKKDESVSK